MYLVYTSPHDVTETSVRPIMAGLGGCGARDKQTTRIMKDLRGAGRRRLAATDRWMCVGLSFSVRPHPSAAAVAAAAAAAATYFTVD